MSLVAEKTNRSVELPATNRVPVLDDLDLRPVHVVYDQPSLADEPKGRGGNAVKYVDISGHQPTDPGPVPLGTESY